MGLVACGVKNGGTTQNPSSSSISSTRTTSKTTTKTSSVGGLTWNDMPIYSGAGKIDTYQWSGSIPAAQGDYSKFEHRYYETNDSLDKVSAFYRSQIPTKGWTEKGWMETPRLKYGMYIKNSENDEAIIGFSLMLLIRVRQ